jgi:hypothetical protein
VQALELIEKSEDQFQRAYTLLSLAQTYFQRKQDAA